ncbi:MAG: ATP-binding cassette domain-containing protein [Chloroflexota bacterium]
MPQNPDDLLFAESVREELVTTLDNHGLHKNPVSIDEMLAGLGTEDVGDQYPRDLSIGQRQRVALGAVTVTHPPVVLLDEPTRGLDGSAKKRLVHIMKAWLAKGVSVLLVTHDVELANMIADRVIIMADGEIIADGDARSVLGASPQFAPQIARLFPNRGWLTVEDALQNLPSLDEMEETCPD